MTVRAVELGGEARGPVDWASYAAAYDLMLDHNPAYHAIVERYRRFLGGLDLAPGAGFAVVAEERAFRDASDLIIVRKPLASAATAAPTA